MLGMCDGATIDRVLRLADEVRRHGGHAEVVVVSAEDHVGKLANVESVHDLRVCVRAWATTGKLLVTSESDLAMRDALATRPQRSVTDLKIELRTREFHIRQYMGTQRYDVWADGRCYGSFTDPYDAELCVRRLLRMTLDECRMLDAHLAAHEDAEMTMGVN